MGPVPRFLLSHCQKESFKKNIHVLPARPAYARNVNCIYFLYEFYFTMYSEVTLLNAS